MTIGQDDEPRRPAGRHEIGQDLSRLSVDELTHRIEALRAEIARLEAEIAAKASQRAAADRIFGGR